MTRQMDKMTLQVAVVLTVLALAVVQATDPVEEFLHRTREEISGKTSENEVTIEENEVARDSRGGLGGSCNFVCLLQQPNSRVCGSDGQWYSSECVLRRVACKQNTDLTTGPDQLCPVSVAQNPVTCDSPPSPPDHSRLVSSNGTSVGSYAEYSCDLGFTLGNTGQSSVIVTCQADLMWSLTEIEDCIDPCENHSCTGYKACRLVNNQPICDCDFLCTITADSTVCGSDGKSYSSECILYKVACKRDKHVTVAQEGHCEEITTTTSGITCNNKPASPQNGYEMSSNGQSSFIEYHCYSGMTFPDGSDTMKVRCQGGQWNSNTLPACSSASVGSCSAAPSAPMNGAIVENSGSSAESSVKYQCGLGYKFSDREDKTLTIWCNSDGQWSRSSVPDCVLECGEKYEVQTTAQYMVSPNFPGKYHSNINCTWFLHLNHPGERIKLSILSLHLEDHQFCEGDSFNIYDSDGVNAYLTHELCGTVGPTVIHSYGHILVVNFITNDEVEKYGFKINFIKTPVGSTVLSLDRVLERFYPVHNFELQHVDNEVLLDMTVYSTDYILTEQSMYDRAQCVYFVDAVGTFLNLLYVHIIPCLEGVFTDLLQRALFMTGTSAQQAASLQASHTQFMSQILQPIYNIKDGMTQKNFKLLAKYEDFLMKSGVERYSAIRVALEINRLILLDASDCSDLGGLAASVKTKLMQSFTQFQDKLDTMSSMLTSHLHTDTVTSHYMQYFTSDRQYVLQPMLNKLWKFVQNLDVQSSLLIPIKVMGWDVAPPSPGYRKLWRHIMDMSLNYAHTFYKMNSIIQETKQETSVTMDKQIEYLHTSDLESIVGVILDEQLANAKPSCLDAQIVAILYSYSEVMYLNIMDVNFTQLSRQIEAKLNQNNMGFMVEVTGLDDILHKQLSQLYQQQQTKYSSDIQQILGGKLSEMSLSVHVYTRLSAVVSSGVTRVSDLLAPLVKAFKLNTEHSSCQHPDTDRVNAAMKDFADRLVEYDTSSIVSSVMEALFLNNKPDSVRSAVHSVIRTRLRDTLQDLVDDLMPDVESSSQVDTYTLYMMKYKKQAARLLYRAVHTSRQPVTPSVDKTQLDRLINILTQSTGTLQSFTQSNTHDVSSLLSVVGLERICPLSPEICDHQTVSVEMEEPEHVGNTRSGSVSLERLADVISLYQKSIKKLAESYMSKLRDVLDELNEDIDVCQLYPDVCHLQITYTSGRTPER